MGVNQMVENNDTIEPDQNREEQTLESRRKAIKRILVGGGLVTGATMLPKKWTKPVVDAITVPAHAQASLTTSPRPTTTPA